MTALELGISGSIHCASTTAHKSNQHLETLKAIYQGFSEEAVGTIMIKMDYDYD